MVNGDGPCNDCTLESCQRALDLYNQKRASNETDEMFYTLELLLFNANNGVGAIGMRNAITQVDIISYINNMMGANLDVRQWQNNIEQNLKDKHIIATKIYPGGRPGTFIPCHREELTKPIGDLINRIRRELEHLEDYIDLLQE